MADKKQPMNQQFKTYFTHLDQQSSDNITLKICPWFYNFNYQMLNVQSEPTRIDNYLENIPNKIHSYV